jgi:hypothetical protein
MMMTSQQAKQIVDVSLGKAESRGAKVMMCRNIDLFE